MLRLTFVFLVWIASTAYAIDDEKILLDRASAAHECADGEGRAHAGGDSR